MLARAAFVGARGPSVGDRTCLLSRPGTWWNLTLPGSLGRAELPDLVEYALQQPWDVAPAKYQLTVE